jgi:hypothetical protein
VDQDEEDSWVVRKLNQELEVAGARRVRRARKMDEQVGKESEPTKDNLGSSVAKAAKPGKPETCCG